MDSSLLTLAAFALLLLSLAWSSRQIGLFIQQTVYWISGSSYLAMIVLFLIYLPGIVIHEGSHWVMAKLLGLKTGNFRVWPKKKGNFIGLGSVTIRSGGPLADSLVGLAPLVVGSLIVSWIGIRVFGSQELSQLWQQGDWFQAVGVTFSLIGTSNDGLIWGYLIFAIANAMLPSSSDREPLKPVLLFLGLIVLLYLLVDQSGQFFFRMADILSAPISALSSAFLLTLILDLLILSLLFLFQTVLTLFVSPPSR